MPVRVHQSAHQAILSAALASADTKKKGLVGKYQRARREWQPQGQPEEVLVHDFIDPTLRQPIPYGVYDVGRDLGWVNLGNDHDTASFAAESIRRWWRAMASHSIRVLSAC